MNDLDKIRALCAQAPSASTTDLYPKAAPAAEQLAQPAAEQPEQPTVPEQPEQPTVPAVPAQAEQPAPPARTRKPRALPTPPAVAPPAPIAQPPQAVALPAAPAVKAERVLRMPAVIDYAAEREALVESLTGEEPAGSALVVSRGFTVWAGKGAERKAERSRQVVGLEPDEKFLDRGLARNAQFDFVVVKGFDAKLEPLAFQGLLEVFVQPDQLAAAKPGNTISLIVARTKRGDRAVVRMA